MKISLKASLCLCYSAILIVALGALPNISAAQETHPHTISVVGNATEDSKTTESGEHGLTMNVTSKDATATLAFAKLSDQVRKLRKTLTDAGAESSDITEGEMQMSPSYDYSKAGLPPSITGYQVAKPVMVKVEHEADLAKLIDAATQSGISSVSLGTGATENPGESESSGMLTQAALKDAHERAEELAKQIGATLGDVVSVSTIEPQTTARGGGGEEEERERGRTPQPQKKSVQLQVVYAIR